MEHPSDICKELRDHWEKVESSIHIENGAWEDVDAQIDRLAKIIRQADAQQNGKTSPGDMARLHRQLLNEMAGTIAELRERFFGMQHTKEDEPAEIGEIVLLNALATRLGTAIREHFQFDSPDLPRRNKTRANHQHPKYPHYPDGVLKTQEVTALYEARATLMKIFKTDRFAQRYGEYSESDDHKLHKRYEQAFEQGRKALSRNYGDAAEEMMKREVAAIDKYWRTAELGATHGYR